MTVAWQHTLDSAVDSVFDRMVEIRRHLHRYPEVSGEEHKTSLYLYQLLGNEGFEVALSVGNLTASCAVRWSVAWYEGECLVPDISLAGKWKLEVALDDQLFFTSSVSVSCKVGDYEDPQDNNCKVCPRGARCAVGTTLASLLIVPGYWRTGTSEPCAEKCFSH